jgi:hypothetical protein
MKHIKPYSIYESNSDESIEDFKRLRQLGMIDDTEFFNSIRKLYPDSTQSVEITFNLDEMWVAQNTGSQFEELLKKVFTEGYEKLPEGWIADPDSISVSSQGLEAEEAEEDEWDDDQDYDLEGNWWAGGSIIAYVPTTTTEEDLIDWVNNSDHLTIFNEIYAEFEESARI